MLKELHIQNIAVIHKASVSLEQGLNVFTGETGAGKTILLSAIDTVLGERASRELIRAGEDKAVVTALFEELSPQVTDVLEEQGYADEEGALLITREITAAGKSTCKINGMPATASILKSISSMLIHIHGQRDSGQLLAEDRHMRLIDAYGELGGLLEEYGEAYSELARVREELKALEMDDAQKAQRMDMLTFQIEEIEAAALEDPEEEEALLARRKVMRNSERIREGLSTAFAALQGDGEEEGILTRLGVLSQSVAQAAEYMETLSPMSQRLEELGYEITEFSSDIRTVLDEFEWDPEELDKIEYRLDAIYKLKRKYGGSITEILQFLDKAREELQSITMWEERTLELERRLAEETGRATGLAEQLSARRMAAADRFVRQVEEELAFLDMPSVTLSVERREKPLGPAGIDDMEFYIVTNVGEQPKPLSKIASGGEVSRIMLAIKNVLAEKDDIGTLIFDEVDTGISGRAAQKIGQKLKEVSRSRQVICVTHLAQVASYGDHHLLISKEVAEGRTFTRILPLEREERVRELARITGGDFITDTSLQSAKELLEHAAQTSP